LVKTNPNKANFTHRNSLRQKLTAKDTVYIPFDNLLCELFEIHIPVCHLWSSVESTISLSQ